VTFTLLIHLAGPLQSWGVRSRFDDRDTMPRPTKSGVIGLLAAADGHYRDEPALARDCIPLATLARLRFGVRADRPGVVIKDYHTAGGGTYPLRPRDLITDPRRGGHADILLTGSDLSRVSADYRFRHWYGAPKNIAPDKDGLPVAGNTRRSAVLTTRWYLSDAAFLAAVETPDHALLERLASYLDAPRGLLWLGRKSCIPAADLNAGLHPGTIEDAFAVTPLLPNATATPSPPAWIEASPGTPGAAPVNDHPVSFRSRDRAHSLRWEKQITVTPPAAPASHT
jgi:CRISPR system Cascade subunit CasD